MSSSCSLLLCALPPESNTMGTETKNSVTGSATIFLPLTEIWERQCLSERDSEGYKHYYSI